VLPVATLLSKQAAVEGSVCALETRRAQ
jgi:hypothetical protein